MDHQYLLSLFNNAFVLPYKCSARFKLRSDSSYSTPSKKDIILSATLYPPQKRGDNDYECQFAVNRSELQIAQIPIHSLRTNLDNIHHSFHRHHHRNTNPSYFRIAASPQGLYLHFLASWLRTPINSLAARPPICGLSFGGPPFVGAFDLVQVQLVHVSKNIIIVMMNIIGYVIDGIDGCGPSKIWRMYSETSV